MRSLGKIFLGISAMLYCTRYICAAIYMSGAATWSEELFRAGLSYVGKPILLLSIGFFIVGLILAIIAIKKEH